MTSPRAKTRQAYNALKKTQKQPLMTSPSSLVGNGQSLKPLDSGWQSLSNSQLLSLTETELTEMEAHLSQPEKAALGQKLIAALNQEQGSPSYSWSPPPLNQTAQNGHPAAPTPFSDGHGAETQTASHQAPTPYTDESSQTEPDPDDFRRPLTGKHKKQAQELQEVLGLAAFSCVMLGKTTHNTAFYQDADAIGQYGENVADSWARLARKYPWLYTALDRFVGITAAGLALQSTMQLVQKIAENHGVKLPSVNPFKRPAPATGMDPQPIPFAHAAGMAAG